MTRSSESLAAQLRIAAEIGLQPKLQKRPIAWMRYVCGAARQPAICLCMRPPRSLRTAAACRAGGSINERNSDMANDFGRLAMRVEGDWWVAYLAEPSTMNGALELGRLKGRLAHLPGMKAATLQFYQAVVAAMVKEAIGQKLAWPNDPKSAPEHERSGRA